LALLVTSLKMWGKCLWILKGQVYCHKRRTVVIVIGGAFALIG
jgi:hypothetical protein